MLRNSRALPALQESFVEKNRVRQRKWESDGCIVARCRCGCGYILLSLLEKQRLYHIHWTNAWFPNA
jgi:hypothetical protein